MQTTVEVHGLRKAFGPLQVLDGIDLTVPHGTILGLLGPNGAGKTTLIRILATLLPFDAGQVRIAGKDVVREARAVRGSIGLTGQYASVDELLTGTENLRLLGRLTHLDGAAARSRASALLDRFDLADAADRRVSTYSGGMRRRLDLAASLIAAPPVLFLDEPTTGLDPRSRRTLWEVIRELTEEGITIVLTSQYLEEADALADRIAVLHEGRIVTEGTAAQLKARIGEERLTVRVADAATLGRLVAVLGPDARIDHGAVSASVTVADPEQLRTTLNTIADAAITVTGTQVVAPTLDDVFFAVTSPEPQEVLR